MMAASQPTPQESAGSRLANIVELIEEILLGIDIKTLLLAQRVSRTWKAIIARSLKLQRALFISPAASIEDYPNTTEKFSAENTWHNIQSLDDLTALSEGRLVPKDVVKNVLNPLLYILMPGSRLDTYCWGGKQRQAEHNISTSASWTKMYLTQPPVKSIMLRQIISDREVKAAALKRRTAANRFRVPGYFSEIDAECTSDVFSDAELQRARGDREFIALVSKDGVTVKDVVAAAEELARKKLSLRGDPVEPLRFSIEVDP